MEKQSNDNYWPSFPACFNLNCRVQIYTAMCSARWRTRKKKRVLSNQIPYLIVLLTQSVINSLLCIPLINKKALPIKNNTVFSYYLKFLFYTYWNSSWDLFSPFTEIELIYFLSLMYTKWWSNTFIYCEMITTIRSVITPIISHIYLCVCVCGENV